MYTQDPQAAAAAAAAATHCQFASNRLKHGRFLKSVRDGLVKDP